MASFFESLESRTFLSAAPSVAALSAEGKVVTADLVAMGKTGNANFKLIESDLKSAGELKSSAKLLHVLSIEGTAGFNVTSRGVKGATVRIRLDVNKVVADAALLARHPASTAFAARVTAAETTLSTDANNKLSTVTADLTAQHNTNSVNLQAIETANPGNTTLANDASTTIGPAATNARNTLLADLTTALKTDVNAVIAAFPA